MYSSSFPINYYVILLPIQLLNFNSWTTARHVITRLVREPTVFGSSLVVGPNICVLKLRNKQTHIHVYNVSLNIIIFVDLRRSLKLFLVIT